MQDGTEIRMRLAEGDDLIDKTCTPGLFCLKMLMTCVARGLMSSMSWRVMVTCRKEKP